MRVKRRGFGARMIASRAPIGRESIPQVKVRVLGVLMQGGGIRDKAGNYTTRSIPRG